LIHPKPQKRFGQHFLHDANIARKICHSPQLAGDAYSNLLEIGPGRGILTDLLRHNPGVQLSAVEVDPLWAEYLRQNQPDLAPHIYEQDVLTFDFQDFAEKNGAFGVIGNFPYNMAARIVVKVLDNRSHIPEMVGMFQLEVAQRLAAAAGSKQYGLLSVILQSYYEVALLFRIPPGAFTPPPKIRSGVVRALKKTDDYPSGLDYTLFFQVVKTAFQQRRKKLNNALRAYQPVINAHYPHLLDKRPEQLTPVEFQQITRKIQAAAPGEQ